MLPEPILQMYAAAMRIYASPWFYGLIAVILTLELIWPAIKSQRPLSRAFAQDFMWFNVDGVYKMALLPLYTGLLKVGYDKVTGGFAFRQSDAWPVLMTVVLAFLLSDFLSWFHHWVRHKVTAFWHFHVIHHSQREMNLFTDLRIHAVEYIVSHTISFIPLLMFPLDYPTIMGYGAVRIWHTRLIHANVRTNFGPLRHILVSPQYHRVHHSIELKHRDQNFGVALTIWDRMFGTMYPHYDEYPETGVEGVDFAPPSVWSPKQWAVSFWDQIVYPFRQLRPGGGATATSLTENTEEVVHERAS
jgi:sterol desaturase/sphingolipid hydroxylase (fatty acid hydroxylase superfamily)